MSEPPRWRSSVAHDRWLDVWNEVPLVPQLTGMSCWAAAAAMLVGWRDRIPVSPEKVARGAGRWRDYQDGLHPSDVETFARTWGLVLEPGGAWTVQRLYQRLSSAGPLWLGEASPGLHSIVVTGLYGDGSDRGTFVRINDPWPMGRGERYSLDFRELMRNLGAASALLGTHGQILSTGGGRRGASISHHRESYVETHSFRSSSQAPAIGQPGPSTRGTRYLDTARFARNPLRSHAGSGEALFACWLLPPPSESAIDVVVHLHGYHDGPPSRATLEALVAKSGADIAHRSRPTLALVPRGRKITAEEFEREIAEGKKPRRDRYTFPALTAGAGAGLETLLAEALAWLDREARGGDGRGLTVGRLILTAHSGGGNALNQLLKNHAARNACDPHEVHVFDALYGDTDGLLAWVSSRIDRDRAAAPGRLRSDMTAHGGGCRIVYRAGTREHPGTQPSSEALARELAKPERIGGAAALAPFYRVQLTAVGHNAIPSSFGPRLLADVSVDLASAGSAMPDRRPVARRAHPASLSQSAFTRPGRDFRH
jgi:hypothetical protein